MCTAEWLGTFLFDPTVYSVLLKSPYFLELPVKCLLSQQVHLCLILFGKVPLGPHLLELGRLRFETVEGLLEPSSQALRLPFARKTRGLLSLEKPAWGLGQFKAPFRRPQTRPGRNQKSGAIFFDGSSSKTS